MTRDDALARGLWHLGLTLAAEQRERLLAFAELLLRWNRAFNLISRRDEPRIVPRHLVDALVPAAHLAGTRVADLGSGAGLPGIPLAIASPERSFTLIERSERRTRFLRQAVIELRLVNVEIVTEALQRYRPAGRFDSVVSRALASPEQLWPDALRLLRGEGGVALLQCGRDAAEARFPGAARSRFIETALPGLVQAHCLWVVEASAGAADPSPGRGDAPRDA